MAASPSAYQHLANEFEAVLIQHGLHGALRFLNERTPHRFTGMYRYDGAMLRNVALFDQFNPDLVQGDDAPMVNTFCALVPRFGGVLAFADAPRDARAAQVETPVVSYCGVQLRDDAGIAQGTLCHFDLKPCEVRTNDIPLLEALAPML